jgi:uncharacterized membrane protein
MPTRGLSATAKRNIDTIAEVEQRLAGRRTRTDRISFAIAKFFGTLRFIAAHSVFITVWFVINMRGVSSVHPFDPYPFPFLALIIGIEFIFLTTFVLMNQRLQSRREEHWAHLNLQLAILAEHEVTKNMQMLHLICNRLGIEQTTHDREVKELVQATPVTELVEEIAQKIGQHEV